MCEMTGYVPKTTFWEDFSIAEYFGTEPIKETFKHAFNGWKNNVVYLTELVMVLNWKIWYWYEQNEELGKLYNDLYEKAGQYAYDNLRGDARQYFMRTVD